MPEREGAQAAQHEGRQGEARDLIVDGVERRRQRPKDAKIQAIHYSDKKKGHFDKNVVARHTSRAQGLGLDFGLVKRHSTAYP